MDTINQTEQRKKNKEKQLLEALKEIQKQNADTHAHFQKVMTDAHMAYLKNSELTYKSLSLLMANQQDLPSKLDNSPDVSNSISNLLKNSQTLQSRKGAQTDQKPIEWEKFDFALNFDLDTTPGNDKVPEENYISQDIEYNSQSLADPSPTAEKKAGGQKYEDTTNLETQPLSAQLEPPSSIEKNSEKKKSAQELDIELSNKIQEIDNNHEKTEKASFLESCSPDPKKIDLKETTLKRESHNPKTAENRFVRSYRTESSQDQNGFALPGLWSRDPEWIVYITDCGTSLAPLLTSKLRNHGINAQLVEFIPNEARAIIFLGGLKPIKTNLEAHLVNEEAFTLAQIVLANTKNQGLFVTIQDTGGYFGMNSSNKCHSYLAGLAALTGNIRKIDPSCISKAIDIQQENRPYYEVVEDIFCELSNGGEDSNVGLLGKNSRVTIQTAKEPADDFSLKEFLFKPQDIILAAGGGQGSCAKCLISLAKIKPLRFVLLGKTILEEECAWSKNKFSEDELRRSLSEFAQEEGKRLAPIEISREISALFQTREIKKHIEILEALGSQVSYLPCDVGDTERLQDIVDTMRQDWGPISGLILGAASANQQEFGEQKIQQFRRVFEAKVKGLLNLLELTQQDPLKAIILTSSQTDRLNTALPSELVMAQEAANKIICSEVHHRGANCQIKSIMWQLKDDSETFSSIQDSRETKITDLPADLEENFLREIHSHQISQIEVMFAAEAEPPVPVADDGKAERTSTIYLDQESDPYLKSLVIQNQIVVPMALAIEWIRRFATTQVNALKDWEIENLELIQTMRLENFFLGGDVFLIKSEIAPANKLKITVNNRQGEMFFKATINSQNLDFDFPRHLDLSNFRLDDCQDEVDYGGVLFHGPNFQILRYIGPMNRQNTHALLDLAKTKNWGRNNWSAASLRFDGGLQLAMLWSQNILGKELIPKQVARVRSFNNLLGNNPIHCILQKKKIEENSTISDIYFLDQNHNILSCIEGLALRSKE